jgi:aryl-alcohol dehydrogenase-like predicted oxidoreductase
VRNAISKIVIGTAQLENYYGIKDRKKFLSKKDFNKILIKSKKRNINYLDTAFSYPSVHENLSRAEISKMNVITKIGTSDFNEKLEYKLEQLIKKFKIKFLYGVLFHEIDFYKRRNFKLVLRILKKLKRKKKILKIGVSIYETKDLKKIFEVFRPEIVQFPYNILNDNIYTSGWLQKLKKLKIECHARSIFLQGKLLSKFKSTKTDDKNHTKKIWLLENWYKERNITRIQACLNKVFTNNLIDRVIIGFKNKNEFDQVIKLVINCKLDYPYNIKFKKKFIDPRKW